MIRVSANPVELAVAAAFLGGQLASKDVEAFAQKTAAALEAGGVDPGQWRDAVARWTGAEQTVVWRAKATELLKENRVVLQRIAEEIDAIGRIPAVVVNNPTPAVLNDWLIQLGCGPNGRKAPSEVAADPAFLDKGRFAAYPGRLLPPPEMEVGKKIAGRTEIPIDRSLLDNPVGAKLSKAIDQQWSFLHDRGVEGFINPNTLTRYTYNQFAVRQILDNLEARDVKDGRVLLVTGYETPIHELLDSKRVKEVVVADLSAHAAQVLAEKYAHHPQARKLKIGIKDLSGVSLAAQGEAMKKLGTLEKGATIGAETSEAYFREIAKPASATQVDYASASFDAVHLPFVAGAFHLGAATAAAAHLGEGHVDMEALFGAANLATRSSQQATETVDRHVLEEARRITKRGGLVIGELWARPREGDQDTPIRFSDTPVTKASFDRITAGFEHLFSGNPQPGLPHTVGHVIATIA